MFKISSDCHIPTSEVEDFLKNPYYDFLEEPTLFLLALKLNFCEKEFSYVKTKINSNFALELAERSNQSFSVYMMNL